MFGQLPFLCDLINGNRKEYRYSWIWEKPRAVGFLNANRMPLRAYEMIAVFYDHLPTYNPQFTIGKPYETKSKSDTSNYGKFQLNWKTVNTGTRYPRDVLHWKTQDRGLHPTQKPVTLLEYLIKTYTDPGDVVCDPCMGSGSTGVAALRTHRKFIGIEKDEKYFEIAKERINDEM